MRLGIFVGVLTTLTVLGPTYVMARGTNIHEMENSRRGATPEVSRAGVPTLYLPPPREFLSGCGHGRYRDVATQRCRGPADW